MSDYWRLYTGKVRRVRDTYDQIADENLRDLRLQTRPAREHLLKYVDEEVAKRRADEGAVSGHLGDARIDVMAISASVFGYV